MGIINFLPLAGIVSASALEKAYGITIADSNLEVLLRHRALLFGIVGGFVLFSVIRPVFQTVALVLAGISMFGFVVVALTVGGYNDELSRILLVDLVGLLFLTIAAFLKMRSQSYAPT